MHLNGEHFLNIQQVLTILQHTNNDISLFVNSYVMKKNFFRTFNYLTLYILGSPKVPICHCNLSDLLDWPYIQLGFVLSDLYCYLSYSFDLTNI